VYIIILIVISASYTVWRAILLMDIISAIEKARRWEKQKAIVKDARFVNSSNGLIIHFYAEYNFNGIRFGAKNLTLYRKRNFIEKALIQKMKINEEVDVYINPLLPHVSIFLNPNEHNYILDWIFMMAGTLFTSILIYLVI